MTRIARGVSILLLAVLLVMVVVLITSSWSPPPSPMPNPNGYNDFIKAAQMVSQESGDFNDMNEAELRSLVTTNVAGLKLVALGLTRECRTPMDFSTNFSSLTTDLPGFKRLAQALAAEGRLAELEKRPGDAAQSYLTAVRLGYAVRHGGVIITALVGCAIEAIGTAGLERTLPSLDARQCRDLAAALEQTDAGDESPEQMLRNEHDWARRRYGVVGQLQRLVTFRSLKQSEDKAAAKLNSQQTRLRLLLIESAARAFELDKGSRPRSLADLVPAYLKAVPLDPMTKTNMSYHP